MSIEEFIKSHIWVPILAACAAAVILVLIVWCVCWKRNRRQTYYIPLAGSVTESLDGDFSESLELGHRSMEHKHQESGMLRCQYYLRTTQFYHVNSQHERIGSRTNKNWFLVREPGSHEDLLLSMLPNSNSFVLPFSKQTARTLKDIFSSLKHPHLQPIRGVDFDSEQSYTVLVQPFSSKGSLKDLIHQASPLDPASKKYSARGRPLNSTTIATYGRHILEALRFLKSKGFPPCTNLHTGNIIVYSRVCRLSGHELSLLGHTPKLKRAIDKKNKSAWETILFGHVIFEMASGVVLPDNASSLRERDYRQCSAYPDVTEVLKFVFGSESGQFPSIEEIASLPFFASVLLKELQTYDPAVFVISSSGKSLLKAVRKGRPTSRKRSRHGSEDAGSETSSRASSRSHSRAASRQPSIGHTTTSFQSLPVSSDPSASPHVQTVPTSKPLSSSRGRSALLNQIHAGTKLKKTATKDRSAPKV